MFWGKGDNSKLSAEEKQHYLLLRRLEETGHIIGLTPEQTVVALAAIKLYANVTATTGLLAGVRNVAFWVGGCLVGWWAVKDVVVEFIKSSAGG